MCDTFVRDKIGSSVSVLKKYLPRKVPGPSLTWLSRAESSSSELLTLSRGSDFGSTVPHPSTVTVLSNNTTRSSFVTMASHIVPEKQASISEEIARNMSCVSRSLYFIVLYLTVIEICLSICCTNTN